VPFRKRKLRHDIGVQNVKNIEKQSFPSETAFFYTNTGQGK